MNNRLQKGLMLIVIGLVLLPLSLKAAEINGI